MSFTQLGPVPLLDGDIDGGHLGSVRFELSLERTGVEPLGDRFSRSTGRIDREVHQLTIHPRQVAQIAHPANGLIAQWIRCRQGPASVDGFLLLPYIQCLPGDSNARRLGQDRRYRRR
jgi:hypothetical protein